MHEVGSFLLGGCGSRSSGMPIAMSARDVSIAWCVSMRCHIAGEQEVYVLLPGVTRPVQVHLQLDTDKDSLLETLISHPHSKAHMAKLNATMMTTRVFWAQDADSPPTEVALTVRATSLGVPLLSQVHVVDADGSVSADTVTWASLSGSGGVFFVHVHDTSVKCMWLASQRRCVESVPLCAVSCCASRVVLLFK
ncbi:MAG: hypothetical protein EOO65_03670 [Methanosarcinales archaeon]|nr:MAG: hypothetical protein EOO65_03670 [Methanosarcinales archaeon]